MPKHKTTQPAYPHEIDGVGVLQPANADLNNTPTPTPNQPNEHNTPNPNEPPQED